MKGWMYILECADGSYYTGSTNDLLRRFAQHQNGEGANHTKKHLPVKLVYFEEFDRIDLAFRREKQVQRWSRSKKEALILSEHQRLHELAECMNESHFGLRLRSAHNRLCSAQEVDGTRQKGGFDSAQPPFDSAQPPFDSAQPPCDSAQPPCDSALPIGD